MKGGLSQVSSCSHGQLTKFETRAPFTCTAVNSTVGKPHLPLRPSHRNLSAACAPKRPPARALREADPLTDWSFSQEIWTGLGRLQLCQELACDTSVDPVPEDRLMPLRLLDPPRLSANYCLQEED